jgi:integrase
MPRPNPGPRLVAIRKPGWKRQIFYIRWTENGQKRERATPYAAGDVRGAVAAQEYFEQWLAERRRAARTGPGDPDQVRIADVLDDYGREHGPEVASPATLVGAIEPLRAFFVDDTMANLTTGRVKDYWIWRRSHSMYALNRERSELEIVERGASDATITRELGGVLRPAIKHAIQQKRLVPGEYYVPVPPQPAGRDYWITRNEAARLVRETRRDKRARLHLPHYTLIALYTGQRRGAILDLTWPQIDLVRGRIDFNPPGRIQTKKRRPHIPVPRSLLAALRRAHQRATCEFVISYQGKPIRDVKTGFNSAAARAGIPECTSHTLRHTAGTWMAQRGVPLREIAGYLGHSEMRTTELYAHHHPDYLRAARAAFEGGRGRDWRAKTR